MTKPVSLFEAKAHLSELVRQVAESGESVVISVRGKPKVRVIPYENPPRVPDAWEVREKVVAEYGVPDFPDQPEPGVTIDVRLPFDDQDT